MQLNYTSTVNLYQALGGGWNYETDSINEIIKNCVSNMYDGNKIRNRGNVLTNHVIRQNIL